MASSHFRIYCAVYVFLRKDGCVYLMRRANTGYRDGMYSLPAGHVEEGESLVEAALRELIEETGLVAQPEDVVQKHAMFRQTADRTYADYYFVCEHWEGEPILMEPGKCDGTVWADETALPEECIPEVRHAWACILKGEPFSSIRVDALNVLDAQRALKGAA